MDTIKEGKISQVRHSNAITSARHELSATQLDLYFMLLSLLKPNHINRYEISVKQIENLTGRSWNYQQLKDATLDLIGKVFEIEEPDGLLQVSMLSSAKYVKGTGKIQLTIAEELKPYLVDLKNNFTSFQLYSVLSMSSKYAKWLYVQFSRWKDIGVLKVELEELKFKLNLKDPAGKAPEQYKQWGQFKDNVLEPSMRQINEHSDLEIKYTTEKIGKKINKILFYIKSRKQFQPLIPFGLEDNTTDDIEAIRLKERMRAIGVVDSNLVKSILADPELRIKANKALYDMAFNKTISNPGGYFRKIIGL
jgi:plasmid replication initiation protein